MPDAITYCESCSRLILPSELADGSVVRTPAGAICPECLKQLTPDQRAHLERRSKTHAGSTAADAASVGPITTQMRAQRPPSSRRTPVPGCRTPAPVRGKTRQTTTTMKVPTRKGGGGIMMIVVVMFVAAGATFAVMFAVSESGASRDKRAARHAATNTMPSPTIPASDSTVSAPTEGAPTTARLRLDAIRAMRDDDLRKYREMRTLLLSFEKEFEGAPEVADAARFREALDREAGALATTRLGEARDIAVTLVKMGRFAQARGEVEAVRADYEGTPWFDAAGEEKIREALDEIDRARGEIAAKTLADARAALKAGRYEAVKGALSNTREWSDADRAAAKELRASLKEAAARAAVKGATGDPYVLRGLVGWWRFDEERGDAAVDSSGSGCDGELKGGPTYAPGRVGRALSLDGRDDYVDVSAHVARFEGLKKGTISLWFKMTRMYDVGYSFVSLASGRDGNAFMIGTWEKWPWFELREGDKPQALKGGFEDTTYATGRWYHVAHVVGEFGTRGYLNGRRMPLKFETGGGRSTAFFASVRGAAVLELGRCVKWDHEEWMHRFPGLLDDVRIYDRPLSDAEVARIAKGGAVPASALPKAASASPRPRRPGGGLVAHYTFDGDGAAGARDAVTGAAASIVGGPTPTEGRRGDALSFDGRDDGLVCGVPEGLTLAEVTVALWVKVPARGWAGWKDWWELGTGRGVLVGELLGEYKQSCGDAAPGLYGLKDLPAVGAIELVEPRLAGAGWHHLAYAMSASAKRVHVYVDARLLASAEYGCTLPVTGFSIGFAKQRGDAHVRSEIDDVRVYARALSPADVAAVFGGEEPRTSSSPEASQETGPATTTRRADEAAATDEPKPGPRSAPDLITNGGFERMFIATHFAHSWLPQQIGGRGDYSVRVVRTDAHTGDRSLELRGLEAGTHPGAATTVSVPKGAYVLKLWARTGAGTTADIRASYGDVEAAPAKAGEAWAECALNLAVPRDRRSTLLKIYTTTPDVRVLIDDVSLERIP